MLEFGYVRLYRSLLNWEWYTDSNTKDVFIHLILTANYEPKKWKGKVIQRGQRVYSSQKLADELHMSRQEVRTAIDHLVKTGEVTNQTTPKYSIITVKNYELYQQLTNTSTNSQPTEPNGDETPMNAGLEDDIFQKQHNKNDENSTNKIANNQPNANPYESSENCCQDTCNQPSNQPTANQLSTNSQPQCNKAKESKKAINKKNIYIDAFTSYAAGDSDLLNVLEDFAEMRKAKKKPISTIRTVNMLLKKLDELADDNQTKIKILEKSIFHNWDSVFPLKGDENNGRDSNGTANNGSRSAGDKKETPKYGHVV
ncbi:hypothetical protein [Caproiciproducens galactitolivorans]|uniref:Uncharacterized protein n=1 Tax=Caproiciproducens galactitolivorans TaxID=642589 RepID=A0ABT4BWC4_9FIRM|nr:hypothetical protein [Caproiciproducens galactitolivorans]MCY1715201.1 hypothetical protein [Caproiciproducens galactitolivorans]